ncbi:hypothetical protein [Planctomicrobium sp. SH527]|uniref:hypothetical protein n=1 Tax=Planctomicrobium sp. SH527 TaxID=3448123 RepID=UPI003F5C614E
MTRKLRLAFTCALVLVGIEWGLSGKILLAAQPLESPATAQSHEISLDEALRGITDNANSILKSESILVEYRVVESETFTPSRYGKREAGFHGIVGKKGGWWYSWLEGSPLPLRSPTDIKAIYREGLFARINGKNLVIGGEPTSELYQWWLYTDNLFLDVYQFLPASAKSHKFKSFSLPFLPKAIGDAPSDYHVAGREVVDDVICLVIERPGVDKIWLDPEKGFALRKREIFFDKSRPRQTLDRVVLNQDFIEAKPGCWMPQTQVVDFYPDPLYEAEDVWGKLTCRWTIKTDRIEFDKIDDSLFTIEAPPETHVSDFIRNIEYVSHQAGDVPFGKAIRFAK